MTAIEKATDRNAVFWSTHRLQATIPSVLQCGEPVQLRLTFFGPEGLPNAALDRDIEVGPCPGIEGMPARLRFDPALGGQLTLAGLRAGGESGCAYITLQPEGCPAALYSNPAWVTSGAPPYHIWWGDLHIHTTFSNCSAWACQSPEFAYLYARDATHLNLAAAADHLRGIVAEPGRWQRLRELVSTYKEEGRFLPFLAFESSHASGYGGDNNAYYLNDRGPLFWPDREDMTGTSPNVPLTDLWTFLRASGQPAITIPHHSGRAGKYRSFRHHPYDPEMEPVFEIYSCWGSSESRWNAYPLSGGNSAEAAYFVDALRAGCRYGVIASSDDHRTLPGGEAPPRLPLGALRQSLYPHQGLAAIRARTLTPTAIWDALHRRSCYATTFERTLLDVAIGDLTMGAEHPVLPGEVLWQERRVRVRVCAPPYARPDIVLLRNGEEIARQPARIDGGDMMLVDAEPLDRVALVDAPFHPDPFVVYYVRVETPFRQTQWSSPIWLDLGR